MSPEVKTTHPLTTITTRAFLAIQNVPRVHIFVGRAQVSAMSTPKVMAQVSQHDANGQPAAGLSYSELGTPPVSTSTSSTSRSSKRPKLSAPRLSRPLNLRMDVSGSVSSSDSFDFGRSDPVLTGLADCFVGKARMRTWLWTLH